MPLIKSPFIALFTKHFSFGIYCFVFIFSQSVLANNETIKEAPKENSKEISKDIPRAEILKVDVLGVYFTPPTGAAKELIRYIDGAKKSIQVQAYSFTYAMVAEALAKAAQRGLVVQVIQDAKTAQNNTAVIGVLLQGGVVVRGDRAHAIAHNKVMVIDSEIVVTGSYNFTNSAETRNAENLLILRSVQLAQQYSRNFTSHWEHSYPITKASLEKSVSGFGAKP
jgi:phosphatidylserine/phosphatidylglycerophosphate/cardiolipin synthase-like enzyme